jgi:amidase
MLPTFALTLLGLATQCLAYQKPLMTCTSTQLIKGEAFPTMIDVTLEDLEAGLEAGLFSSVDLVQTYIDRILQVNGTLHMVTEINPDALAIAAEADKMRANGTIVGPLHGIPGMKDIIMCAGARQ